MESKTVLVLGASADTNRYANKAAKLLKDKKHTVVLVNPNEDIILGEKVYPSLAAVREAQRDIDVLTVYVKPEISSSMADDIISIFPERVIFNPGAENPFLAAELEDVGIIVENACTLVLLNTNQF